MAESAVPGIHAWVLDPQSLALTDGWHQSHAGEAAVQWGRPISRPDEEQSGRAVVNKTVVARRSDPAAS